ITLSSFRVNPFFRSFSPAIQASLNRSTPRGVSRCAVSMEAHYRDPNRMHKPFLDLFFWLLTFRSFRCDLMRSDENCRTISKIVRGDFRYAALTLIKENEYVCSFTPI
ncbi:MAG: hypothetical protein E7B29_09835, partial [Mixta calida]